MSKQVKESTVEAQNQQNQLKSQEIDLQMRFTKLSTQQRQFVGNYLNAYNLAAWIYNEIIDEDCRIYIDLAMKYTLETQSLANSMRDISDNPQDVDYFVRVINDGE